MQQFVWHLQREMPCINVFCDLAEQFRYDGLCVCNLCQRTDTIDNRLAYANFIGWDDEYAQKLIFNKDAEMVKYFPTLDVWRQFLATTVQGVGPFRQRIIGLFNQRLRLLMAILHAAAPLADHTYVQDFVIEVLALLTSIYYSRTCRYSQEYWPGVISLESIKAQSRSFVERCTQPGDKWEMLHPVFGVPPVDVTESNISEWSETLITELEEGRMHALPGSFYQRAGSIYVQISDWLKKSFTSIGGFGATTSGVFKNTLVLGGVGGSGKSTLAKRLIWGSGVKPESLTNRGAGTIGRSDNPYISPIRFYDEANIDKVGPLNNNAIYNFKEIERAISVIFGKDLEKPVDFIIFASAEFIRFPTRADYDLHTRMIGNTFSLPNYEVHKTQAERRMTGIVLAAPTTNQVRSMIQTNVENAKIYGQGNLVVPVFPEKCKSRNVGVIPQLVVSPVQHVRREEVSDTFIAQYTLLWNSADKMPYVLLKMNEFDMDGLFSGVLNNVDGWIQARRYDRGTGEHVRGQVVDPSDVTLLQAVELLFWSFVWIQGIGPDPVNVPLDSRFL
jgi:hypothetical protein